ncbi:MAG TPA: protein translocase subunit SecF [Clostridiales bacterium]|nr:protein translocase subunit SecF [Clostridiales bacterium]
MRKNINFVGNIKKYLICSAMIFIIGIIFMFVFGVNLDINFKGGTRFTYTFENELSLNDADTVIEETIGKPVDVIESTDITGASKKLIITLAADEAVSTEIQKSLTEALQEKFPDNNIQLGDSNTVNPLLAKSFFAKSIAAVLLASILVIIYIGIRFRRIGGISAGIMAWVALFHDILVAFFTCVIFKLQIDANFMAVVLTILGYSLNDTIVIYDRIRDNRKKDTKTPIGELVNLSINQTLGRTLMTSVATLIAMLTVIVVAEIYGLTTLRSFAIPMALGIISGSYSTICLTGPLWVKWIEFKDKRERAKGRKNKKK